MQSRHIPRGYIAHFQLSRVFATKPLTTQAMVGSLRNDEGTERQRKLNVPQEVNSRSN